MQARTNYITPDQFKQLIDGVDTLELKKFNHEDVKMLFKVCYWMALRIGEALKINVEDFDFEVMQVYLGKTKTEKQGFAKIPEVFRLELLEYLLDKKGPLFPGMNRFIVSYWLKTLGKRYKIKALTTSQEDTEEKTITHIFRKSMAKDMFYGIHGEKAPLTFVSDTLRHKGKNRLAATQEYLKITGEDLDDFWKRIAKKEEESQV
uniref:ORF79 n=1 Tax=Nitrosopumilaceae spindle-shaped virus TaxID=3065433 RepID=A0AAT9JAJ8_9VIRU